MIHRAAEARSVLGKHIPDHLGIFHAGEALVEALVLEGEFLVVQTDGG